MAKGDKKKMQTAVNTATGRAQEGLDAVRSQAIVPEFSRNQAFYDQSARQQMGDYTDIMDRYRAMAAEGVDKNKPGLERVNYTRSPEMNEAFGGYRNFMNTGGFSDADVANMRARGISPIRSIYANMTNEMDRQKNLQGGYSPNYNAAAAKMRSGTSQQIADQVQNVNAALAEQIQKGKMFGTEGMGNLSTSDTGFDQAAQMANQQAGLRIAENNLNDPRMSALHGMANMFGTTPGMANMFGNQTQQSINNWLNAEGQQQGIGQMGIHGQQAVAQIPSNFETGFNRVGQGLQMAGNVAGGFMGLPTKIPKIPGKAVAGTKNINSGLYGLPTNIPRQNSPYV